MHWYSRNNVVQLLNKVKSQLFQSIANEFVDSVTINIPCMYTLVINTNQDT